MTDATPRPWTLEEMWSGTAIKGPPKRWSDCGRVYYPTVGRIGPNREERANAELIVRAVNAHEALMAALERYATHAHDCSVRQAFGIRCDCGLSDLFQRYVIRGRGEAS